MPQSAIDRLPALGHKPDPLGGLTFPSYNRTNVFLERISSRARRLRGSSNGSFQNALTLQGRNDSLEQLLVRLGVIPVISLPTATSLSATLQTFPSDRAIATPETVTAAGGTSAQVFTAVAGTDAPDAVAVAFTASGNAQAVTATDSTDSAAKGRALVDILP